MVKNTLLQGLAHKLNFSVIKRKDILILIFERLNILNNGRHFKET